MGRAFHRKQIEVGRGHSRGTGISYKDRVTPPPFIRTPKQIAALEAEAAQKADAAEQRRILQQRVEEVVQYAGKVLAVWKQYVDKSDQQLATFPGWTKDEVCAIPVDPQVAGIYRNYVREYLDVLEEHNLPFDLSRLDGGIKFALERNVPTEEVVAQTLVVVRYAARHAWKTGQFDSHVFVIKLEDRADRSKHLSGALDFLCDHVEAAQSQEATEVPTST